MGHYPDKLLFQCDAVFGISFQLKRQNGSLAYAEFTSEKQPITKKRFTPEYARWEEFWGRVDFLGVWKWREQYASKETGYELRDGLSWQLEIEKAGRSVWSEGTNAYPSFESIDTSSLGRERFGFLQMSFEALIGEEIPIPPN